MNFPVDHLKGIETPFYYYDVELLERTISTVREEAARYGNFHVHYAIKANFNPKLLQIINDENTAELMQSFTVKYDTLEKEQAILHQEEMLKWRSFLIILLITLLVLLCVLLYISRKTPIRMS